MIVVMKTSATEAQILDVQKHIRELGFKDHRIHGEERNVVAVLGHVYPELVDELGVLEGVDTVVRAFNLVAASEPHVRLEILGSGSCLAEVRRLVEPYAQDKVCFRGALPRAA